MIRHHQGALTMVQELYTAGGGAEPDAGAFARHVESDQQIEIGRMQQLLNGTRSALDTEVRSGSMAGRSR